MSRLTTISLYGLPGLEGIEKMHETVIGFVLNDIRIMARRPEISDAQ
jgi:hypothetical protein